MSWLPGIDWDNLRAAIPSFLTITVPSCSVMGWLEVVQKDLSFRADIGWNTVVNARDIWKTTPKVGSLSYYLQWNFWLDPRCLFEMSEASIVPWCTQEYIYIYINRNIHAHTCPLVGMQAPIHLNHAKFLASFTTAWKGFFGWFFFAFPTWKSCILVFVSGDYFYGFYVIHHEWHHHLGREYLWFFPTTFSKSKFQKVFFAMSWLRCRRYGRWQQWKACYFANSHAVLLYI